MNIITEINSNRDPIEGYFESFRRLVSPNNARIVCDPRGIRESDPGKPKVRTSLLLFGGNPWAT